MALRTKTYSTLRHLCIRMRVCSRSPDREADQDKGNQLEQTHFDCWAPTESRLKVARRPTVRVMSFERKDLDLGKSIVK